MLKEKKKELIDKAKINDKDTGSADVQIAILTERITHLTEHLATHKKDHHTRYGLLMMVGRRKSLQKYLKRTDAKRYSKLAESLGIK